MCCQEKLYTNQVERIRYVLLNTTFSHVHRHNTWELIVSHEDRKDTFMKCSNSQVQTLQLTMLILRFGCESFLSPRDNLIMLCSSFASCLGKIVYDHIIVASNSLQTFPNRHNEYENALHKSENALMNTFNALRQWLNVKW